MEQCLRHCQHFAVIDPRRVRGNNLYRSSGWKLPSSAIHFSRQQCEEFRYRVAFGTKQSRIWLTRMQFAPESRLAENGFPRLTRTKFFPGHEGGFVNSPLRETDVASPLLSYERRVRKAKRPRDEVSADAKKQRREWCFRALTTKRSEDKTWRSDGRLRSRNSESPRPVQKNTKDAYPRVDRFITLSRYSFGCNPNYS